MTYLFYFLSLLPPNIAAGLHALNEIYQSRGILTIVTDSNRVGVAWPAPRAYRSLEATTLLVLSAVDADYAALRYGEPGDDVVWLATRAPGLDLRERRVVALTAGIEPPAFSLNDQEALFTAAVRAVIARHDLAALWRGVDGLRFYRRLEPINPADYARALRGRSLTDRTAAMLLIGLYNDRLALRIGKRRLRIGAVEGLRAMSEHGPDAVRGFLSLIAYYPGW